MATVLKKIQLYADLVKFEHTIFALPFALSAVLLASGNQWPHLNVVLWVILAMVGGRTFAMGLNRIIDRQIDGANPRTCNRVLAAGKMKAVEAWLLTIISLCLMVFSTLHLPTLCIQLLPLAIFILAVYSYVKRFSSFAHFVLGLALGASTVGGWIAVTGSLSLQAIAFGLAILFWVAGFDIIYACQDVSFDKEYGLFSIPVTWGIKTGLKLSRLFHVLTVLLLCWIGFTLPHLNFFYGLAVGLVAAMLVYEHSLVSHTDLTRINEAFFTVNGLISIGVFCFILLNKILLIEYLLR